MFTYSYSFFSLNPNITAPFSRATFSTSSSTEMIALKYPPLSVTTLYCLSTFKSVFLSHIFCSLSCSTSSMLVNSGMATILIFGRVGLTEEIIIWFEYLSFNCVWSLFASASLVHLTVKKFFDFLLIDVIPICVRLPCVSCGLIGEMSFLLYSKPSCMRCSLVQSTLGTPYRTSHQRPRSSCLQPIEFCSPTPWRMPSPL